MHIVHNNNNPKHFALYEQEYLAWYQHKYQNPGVAFDPSLFVQLVREQHPDNLALAEAFARCTHEWPESELYTHFLSPLEMEARWRYAGGIWLQHPTLGELLIDLIHDEHTPDGISIGGMEYMDRVMCRGMSPEERQRELNGR